MNYVYDYTYTKEVLNYEPVTFRPIKGEDLVNEVIRYYYQYERKRQWGADFHERDVFFIIKLYCKDRLGIEKDQITHLDMVAAEKDIRKQFKEYWDDYWSKYPTM